MKLVLTPHLQYKAKDVSSTMTNVEIAKDIHFLTFDVKNVNYDNYRISPQSLNITGFPHNIHNLSL